MLEQEVWVYPQVCSVVVGLPALCLHVAARSEETLTKRDREAEQENILPQ